MSESSDRNKLFKQIQKRGWIIKSTKGGHYILKDPKGLGIIITSGTRGSTFCKQLLMGDVNRLEMKGRGR